MTKQLERKGQKLLILLLSICSLIYFGCKKLDTSQQNNEITNSQTAEKFFNTPPNTTLEVRRIIENIKVRNNKKEFISDFASNYGFPVWEKIIKLKAKHKNENNQSSFGANIVCNTFDTVIFIPIVLASQTNVNGFIKAIISDSINLSFCLAQDYKNYSFETSEQTQSQATQFAFSMIYLNKLVFGNRYYTINDNRLFSTNTTIRKTGRISFNNASSTTSNFSNGSNLLDYIDICDHVNVSYVNCAYPGYPQCTPACDQCGACMSTLTIETCVSIYVGGGGGSGGPVGGSGGGGGDIPHTYPCIPIANFTNNLLPGDPLPPCPPPSGGSGWNTAPPFNINNPCNVVDSLLKTAPFPIFLKKLRDSVVRPYEQGISYENPFSTTINTTSYTGTQDSLAVKIEPANPTDGIAHNHNNSPDRLSIYSIEDIYRLAYINSVGKVKDAKIFTYPLVTDSTSYIIMITDTAKFGIFSRTWFDSPKHINAFRTQMYENYSLGLPGLTNLENEKNFLQGINSYPAAGCGLKLFRGNTNMTTFSPIKVIDLNGLIKILPDPCN